MKFSSPWSLVWLAVSSLGLATPAAAGVIRGVLKMSAPAPSTQPQNLYPGRAASLPGTHEVIRGAPGDAVIWLERVPADADTAFHPRQPKLAQKDQRFVPRVLPVAVGTAVDFPNLDAIFHNVFSASPARRFDLGKYPRGQSKKVTFDRAGLINVYCDIHSNMEGFVLVLPTRAFTQPAADGAFALPPVPPGRYLLHVWHPDLPEIRREVELPASGDLNLELGR